MIEWLLAYFVVTGILLAGFVAYIHKDSKSPSADAKVVLSLFFGWIAIPLFVLILLTSKQEKTYK